ncbi:MAG: hypothetical protein J5I93_17690 [Pirellulaceae bacterium]|nr:hypothetical protein [Pirellulaceae bacterium]
MKKHDVLELVQRFPDEIDAEQLIEELYVRAKVEAAERAIGEGRTCSQAEAKRQVESWRK